MRRAFSAALVATLLGVAASGCGAGTPEPARHPTGPVTEREPRRLPRVAPPLIAPPPAYGNKIVMARGPSSEHVD